MITPELTGEDGMDLVDITVAFGHFSELAAALTDVNYPDVRYGTLELIRYGQNWRDMAAGSAASQNYFHNRSFLNPDYSRYRCSG